ncbi:fimbrial protein [Aquitalea sp. LB_tupeE]|uniref:fimbrial protein n=1 Tax=Aquitalea sp. LB_tupeE TaxID=2748078 RepID=UPI0015BF5F12|nr:fimbrial protein [Aquitalea sp. LB_tupeE]NWK76799.1 fimbrial protein [Aquitalea sp. LB_tupeE]
MIKSCRDKIKTIGSHLFGLLVLTVSPQIYAANVPCTTEFGSGVLEDQTVNASLTPSSLVYTGPANKSGSAGASYYASTYQYCNGGGGVSRDPYRLWATSDSAIQFTANGRVILPDAPGFVLSIGVASSLRSGGSIEYLTSNSRKSLKQMAASGSGSQYDGYIWPYILLESSGIPIKSGTYTIPKTLLMKIEVRSPSDTAGNGADVNYINVYLNTFTITATTATCTVKNQTLTVPFPASNTNAINNTSIGSSIFTKPFSIQLNCPTSGGPDVYTTFTDNNNPGNTSDTLSLDPSSSAKGLAVQLKYKGSPIKFGPDTSMPGNTNQFLLQKSASGLVSYDFDAALIKTGAVTPGDYKATATYTMSYQ